MVIMDPPWKGMSSNPYRGPMIDYKTLTMDEIKNILLIWKPEKVLGIWIVNSVVDEIIEFMENQNFELFDRFTHVKLTKNGKLFRGYGNLLQHSKDTCLFFKNSKITLTNKLKKNFCIRRFQGNSIKSKDCIEFFEEAFDFKNKCELFARTNNIKRNWDFYGNQIQIGLKIETIYINKAEIEKNLLI